MKPVLRTIRTDEHDKPAVRIGVVDGSVGYPLPPDMLNCADAVELRAFLRNFRKVESPDDRRKIMEAVFLAAGGDG